MNVWSFVYNKVQANLTIILLFVLESEGSSPGRQGFAMVVAADGSFIGTIGGGIMEYKLVEKAKVLLQQQVTSVSVMQQYHDKQHSEQSGMICSGRQLIAFVPLDQKDLNVLAEIESAIQLNTQLYFQLSPNGLTIFKSNENIQVSYQQLSDTDWKYIALINQQPIVHIIGGGHVSLAVSQQMSLLGYTINVYDDREDLSTLVNNQFAKNKLVVDYNNIAMHLQHCESDVVVIMTVGYRTDKIVLKQLLPLQFAYIGLMGSEEKINTLHKELVEEGIAVENMQHVFMPIGLPIYSKTTAEIAVSIAAEIIKEKNKQLPTGRKKSP